eukprot:24881-Karenia_brevis.AAC.1
MTAKRHSCSAIEQPVAAVLPVRFPTQVANLAQQVTPGNEGMYFCNPAICEGRRAMAEAPAKLKRFWIHAAVPPG